MYIYSPQQISTNSRITAEIVIIGSGAGGATIAQQMVAAGFDTLLLEEGPFIPLEDQTSKNSESIHQQWRNGGRAGPCPQAETSDCHAGRQTQTQGTFLNNGPEHGAIKAL